MNSLSIQNQQTMSMSSTEISKLTGKEKGHVHRDIQEQILKGLYEIDNPKMDDVEIKGISVIIDNRSYVSEYVLDKEHTVTLISGYDVKMRHAISKRWLELEQQAIKPIDPMELFSDAAAMLQLATNYAKRLIEQNEVIAEQAPKVAALARLSEAEGSLNVTESAKALGIQPSKLFLWLQTNGWIYRRAGNKNWLGYQGKVQRGYLTHKVRPILLQDGTERIEEQVRIMPKGLTKLAKVVFSVGTSTGGAINV